MSYQESMRRRTSEYLDKVNRTGATEYMRILVGVSMIELLAIIADELHEMNRRGENGETVQT